jgi:hypothetical protein
VNSSTLDRKALETTNDFCIPVFFVDLNSALNHHDNPMITGVLSSVLEMENGTRVLLVNDCINPTLSVYATVQFLTTGIEGIEYQFGYYQTDIGVPSNCI